MAHAAHIEAQRRASQTTFRVFIGVAERLFPPRTTLNHTIECQSILTSRPPINGERTRKQTKPSATSWAQAQLTSSQFLFVRHHDLSLHNERICNLLEKRERSELDFLNFMASTYNEYELKDGNVFFRSPKAGQRYSEFAKGFENSDKEIDAARKEWFNIKTNIRKLSQ
jgi:hypothetical protein